MDLTNTVSNILRETGVEPISPPTENVLFRAIARNINSRTATRIAKKLKIDIRQIWNTQRHYLPLHKAIQGSDEGSLINLLRSIYNVNPQNRGLYWSCAMESAIRIINLRVIASHYQSKAIDQYILQERTFILNNLETHSSNNHILFNYLGLYLSQPLLNPSEHSNEPSNERIEHQLRNLIREQFFAEGTNFEASTGYHFLASEAMAIATLLEPDFQNVLPDEKSWYQGSRNFMACTLTEQDDFLAIGDDDSGSCLFPIQQPRMRKLQLELYQIAFHDKLFDNQQPNYCAFRDFGLAYIQGKRSRIALAATGNNQNGVGGHAHNDKLAIAFSYDGIWLIGDSGTGNYSKRRNYWRSVRAHSTIEIKGEEPNPFTNNRFALPDNTQAKLDHCDHTRLKATSRYGSQRICRSILFAKGTYQIEDNVEFVPVGKQIFSNLITQRKPTSVFKGKSGDTTAVFSTEHGSISVRYNGCLHVKRRRRSSVYGKVETAYAISLVWPQGATSIRWELDED